MTSEEIPGPTGYPIIGNVSDIDPANPQLSLARLTDLYGPIWKISIAGTTRIFATSQALMQELADEKRFSKSVSVVLRQVRNGVHDGLFTSFGPQEKNWGVAHRVLMPTFGPLKIKALFEEMHDIASQLVMKWARHGPEFMIPVTDDFTRLTLDTLALCAMDYRFNSYYTETVHPFIEAMSDFLKTSGERSRRTAFAQNWLYGAENQKYAEDIEILRKTSQDVINHRKQNPTDRPDLLNAMLNGVDLKTGEKMSEDSVINNMITFLIAGHETTSGLLSFTFYYLLKNPEAFEKAQQEVDEVVGKKPITAEHLSRLPYINAVLRETLRLSPTAPAISVEALKDEVIGGKYSIPKGQSIVCFLPKIHRDPTVWGEDNEEFRPERVLDENFDRINQEFPHCWKPFGNGMRACIGRPFAWQEALLVVAMLLQNFNFSMEDPSYNLRIKQTLTIKPDGFYMRAHLRNHKTATELERALASTSTNGVATKTGQVSGQQRKPKFQGKPVTIVYGSNTGTCEALASRLAAAAPDHGFQADTVDSLDSVKDNVPTDKPIVFITASYEGEPPENAAHFVTWLEGLKDSELKDTSYAVFGCGHHDWAKTFHRIPKLVDALVEERGGKRIAQIGLADVGSGDIFSDFEAWEDQIFWPAIKKQYGISADDISGSFDSSLDVEVSNSRSSTLRQDVREARVEEAEILSSPGQRLSEKRHIEISLPSDMGYSAGDYLAVLPLNPKENVSRVMRYFGLPWDSTLTIKSGGPTNLPTNTPVSASDVFGAYVELAQPASKRQIQALAETTSDEATKEQLASLADSAFSEQITAKRVSVLDLLERFPSVQLPLGAFLKMQPPMRVRQYSISSSPLWNPNNVTLTWANIDQPALSGQGRYLGVASNYLSSLTAGDKLHVAVRPSHKAFHLPKDAKNIPIIMIAAGTGIAPFRGFIQERAAQIAAGRPLAPALLFYGCHSADTDALYTDLLSRWEKLGAVSVRYAFSRAPEKSFDCKYVQDRLYHDRKEVVGLFDAGAKVFVCGSSQVGKGVQDACVRVALERRREVKVENGEDPEEVKEEAVQAWFEGLKNERFATDVFT